jgi:hypothetical protein
MATHALEHKLVGFQQIANHLLGDERLTDAHDLVKQALRALEQGFDGLIRKVQLVGESIHADELSADAEFWRGCEQGWGTGRPGYRNRVNNRNKEWFEGTEADHRVETVIHEEWANVRASIDQLMPNPGTFKGVDAAA